MLLNKSKKLETECDLLKNQTKIEKEQYELLIEIFKDKYKSNINGLDNYRSKLDNNKYEINISNYNLAINNYIKYINLYNDFNLPRTKTICTTLKIIRNDKLINYAYIYGIVENNKVINKYIITSNSLISKDGEYKHRLIPIDKLKILDSKIFDEIFKYINNELKNKEFDLTYIIFNLTNKNIKSNYINQLQNKSLLIKIYIVSWVIEIYFLNRKDQYINSNETYYNIMFSNKDLDKFKEIYKKYTKEIDEYRLDLIQFNKKINLKIGQKLIPFNYIELKEYNNIIHSQWKEILINKICTNLLYNNISPCFSTFIQWILIQNSNKNLYDNIEIYKKILYSDKTKEILNYLYLAQNNFLQLKSITEKTRLIDILIKKLKKIIVDSESTILMSNMSLCYFTEHCGKTIYDYLMKLSDKQINPNIGNIFEDYDIFAKYIFEIIYSLYSLNLKGIIHGDLHLNNITFNVTKNKKSENNIIYDLNHKYSNDILNYIINYSDIKESNKIMNYDKFLENCYLFKHYNTHACIIDYSRSYILLNLIDEDIIEKEKNKIRSKYISNEKKRIIGELNKIFPNYIKNNSHKIKFLFKNKNFNILFIYFSAYDTFTFTTNLLLFMKKLMVNKNIKINDKIIDLLTNISKKSYEYLELILDENQYNLENKLSYPNYLILQEFFKEYITNKNTIKYPILSIYNLHNITKYNSIQNIKNSLYHEILNYKSNLNSICYKRIKEIFQNLINIEDEKKELDIEKIINKEYYNIKSNLHMVTSSMNKSIDTTYDVTTNSISISNY